VARAERQAHCYRRVVARRGVRQRAPRASPLLRLLLVEVNVAVAGSYPGMVIVYTGTDEDVLVLVSVQVSVTVLSVPQVMGT
jgi:hypothetical protein